MRNTKLLKYMSRTNSNQIDNKKILQVRMLKVQWQMKVHVELRVSYIPELSCLVDGIWVFIQKMKPTSKMLSKSKNKNFVSKKPKLTASSNQAHSNSVKEINIGNSLDQKSRT